jgi:hypothetical protein
MRKYSEDAVWSSKLVIMLDTMKDFVNGWGRFHEKRSENDLINTGKGT